MEVQNFEIKPQFCKNMRIGLLSGMLIGSVTLALLGNCSRNTKVYANKGDKGNRGKFCLDFPQPLLVFKGRHLQSFEITIQDDTAFIHNMNDKWNQHLYSLYYLDFPEKTMRRIKRDTLIFYEGAKTARAEKIWQEKPFYTYYFLYLDNINHPEISKIACEYDHAGRGAKINSRLNLYDSYNRLLNSWIMPYYGNNKIETINVLNEKLILICSDIDSHQNPDGKPLYEKNRLNNDSVYVGKSGGYNYKLYVFNINDFLKRCAYSTNNTRRYNESEPIPLQIPRIAPASYGRVEE